MPTQPQFDVLAQRDVPPDGNATTLYTPPTGRAAILAGVRIVAYWPQADQKNAVATGMDGDGRVFFTTETGQSNLFPDYDADKETIGYHVNNSYYVKTDQAVNNGQLVQWYARSDKSHQLGSRSAFQVLVGSSAVTGILVSPLPGSHMDIKVPVVTNQKPLKITSGIFRPVHYDQRFINKNAYIAQNYRRRCPTLVVTVFGQLIDND